MKIPDHIAPVARPIVRTIVVVCAAAVVVAGGRHVTAQGDRGKQEFARAGCATCHGPSAQGAEAPALAGTSRPYAEFVRIVREGTGEMSPHSKDEVSDEQLTFIYKWLVGLSPKDAPRPRPGRASN